LIDLFSELKDSDIDIKNLMPVMLSKNK